MSRIPKDASPQLIRAEKTAAQAITDSLARLDGTAADATMARRVALWDAINLYVKACGGDPNAHVYGNTARQKAVAEIERVVFPREQYSAEAEALRLELRIP